MSWTAFLRHADSISGPRRGSRSHQSRSRESRVSCIWRTSCSSWPRPGSPSLLGIQANCLVLQTENRLPAAFPAALAARHPIPRCRKREALTLCQTGAKLAHPKTLSCGRRAAGRAGRLERVAVAPVCRQVRSPPERTERTAREPNNRTSCFLVIAAKGKQSMTQ